MSASILRRLSITCALTCCTALSVQAAPYELRVYSDEIAAPDELEVESMFSLARPRSASVSQGRIWQALLEVNYGFAKGWEIGFEVPAVAADGERKTQGLAVELQYVAPHDRHQGWYWGLRGDLGRTASVYEDDTDLTLDLNPIIGFRSGRHRFAFNPSLERALRGPERVTRFHPAAKWAWQTSANDGVGLEYYGGWGPANRPLKPAKRDESLYLVWDKRVPFGRINLGLGQPLRPVAGSADKWVAKVGVQFETD